MIRHEITKTLFKYVVMQIHKISVFLIGQKKHYMDVPQHVFTMKFEFIVFNFLHIIPAMILAIVFPVKIFPQYSEFYQEAVKKNGEYMLLTVIIAFIFFLVFVGVIVEKLLAAYHTEYRDYINDEDELGGN